MITEQAIKTKRWFLVESLLNYPEEKLHRLSLDISRGLDDFGVSVSLEGKDQTVHSFAYVVNISELKVGFEISGTRQLFNSENQTETNYVNFSLTAMGLAAVALAVYQGDFSYLFSVNSTNST